MKNQSIAWTCGSPILFLLIGLLTGCLIQDGSNGNSGGSNFTCDATSTAAEICIQEPASLTTQAASKSTCQSTKGIWSEAGQCPSGYKQKCADGDQTNYYYGNGDQNKSCSELVAFAFAFTRQTSELAAQSRAP